MQIRFFIDEAIRLLLFVTPKSIVKKNLCANCTNGICELEVTPTLLFVWLLGIMSKYESFKPLELGVSGLRNWVFQALELGVSGSETRCFRL